MYYALLVLLILVSIVLVAAILMQSGKGGGLAASFGGASSSATSFIGTRQAGNLLTKVSWWGGGLFIGLALVLQIMSTRTRVPRSILEEGLTPPPAPAQQAQPGQGTAPAVPLTPAPGNPAPTSPAPQQ